MNIWYSDARLRLMDFLNLFVKWKIQTLSHSTFKDAFSAYEFIYLSFECYMVRYQLVKIEFENSKHLKTTILRMQSLTRLFVCFASSNARKGFVLYSYISW